VTSSALRWWPLDRYECRNEQAPDRDADEVEQDLEEEVLVGIDEPGCDAPKYDAGKIRSAMPANWRLPE
jgi:hypothetical protein